MQKKIIYFLLIATIVLSSALAYKIKQTTSYDPETYAQVYEEFNKITNLNSTSDTDFSPVISKKTTYVSRTFSDRPPKTIAAIHIPKINISYPIINDYSEKNLNIAPTKFIGPEPNNIGNFVIAGHNNWNKDFFSNLHKLDKGDSVELTDTNGKKLIYKVYDIFEVEQDDFSCLNQETDGKIELTLITCIKHQKNKRLIVKCTAI